MSEATLRLKFKCRISTHFPVAPDSGDSQTSHANYMMITMGAFMEPFKTNIPPSGEVQVDHVFKRRKPMNDYYNQNKFESEYYSEQNTADGMTQRGLNYDIDAKDTQIKSHAILWIYKRRFQDRAKPHHYVEGNLDDPALTTDSSIVMRSYLIAAASISLVALMEVVDSEKKEVEFKIRHNCSESYARCTILHTSQNNQDETAKLVAGLKEFDDLEAKSEGKDVDITDLKFVRSYLSTLQVVSTLVTTQQDIIKTLCLKDLQDAKLLLGDELGAAFISGSTFLQLYGAGVSFTDMTSIVKQRIVEFPVSWV
jgi:hypothetical protein